jgi:hypothetical protein
VSGAGFRGPTKSEAITRYMPRNLKPGTWNRSPVLNVRLGLSEIFLCQPQEVIIHES